ncbi:hypothetical protein [Paractinoplanes globisporus]|uniref:Carboxypeptidase regulatory-like domain-containing protein n=1 Tax=Paractinoplanes globisporus TaxID=113565 RepID=A0ABW6WST0_9ACTN|nr:hypothetical protein [Actinoplanes globisporus]
MTDPRDNFDPSLDPSLDPSFDPSFDPSLDSPDDFSEDEIPLDDLDLDILARIGRDDPPPADLDERVLFALALTDLDAEVARLAAGSPALARAGEQARTVTFDAASRTVMITIVERGDNLVRVDGWLAPGAALLVELRLPEPAAPRVVTADDTGRFVLDEVPHGLAQLLIHPPDAGTPRVVTPSLLL